MGITFGPSRTVGTAFSLYEVRNCPLGSALSNGGILICRAGGVAWIVAPSSSEVSRDWPSKEDAVTLASLCTTATGWFLPNINQLQNPGAQCKSYWDHNGGRYWSSSEYDVNLGRAVCMSTSNPELTPKTWVISARSFRCVTY